MICDSDEKFCREPAAPGLRLLGSFEVKVWHFASECGHSCSLGYSLLYQVGGITAVGTQFGGGVKLRTEDST